MSTLQAALPDLNACLSFFSRVEMPILYRTVRRLNAARLKIDSINGRDLAEIILQDPLMTISVLAYIQSFQGKYLQSDITTVGSAIMMLGIEPFFARFEAPATIESVLGQTPQALAGVMHVIRRAERASLYARDWAVYRHDMDVQEVRIAALLHDLAEILLWCFAPQLGIEIRNRQAADKTLRSVVAQEQVLGIRVADLQLALCNAWHLPELLKTLMDEKNAHLARVQNVLLAVNLARHSAQDWRNAALPDDFVAIASLLHLKRNALLARLDIPEECRVLYQEQDELG